jgi:cation diffusion facilitator CzcD-associated flavoprotein CzcO
MSESATPENAAPAGEQVLDAIIIGAGYSGMYALHRFRELGLKVRVYDQAGGVGGTWWWNRYPGARVDFPGGPLYCYTFSEELAKEWDWTETHPDQPSVLAYLNYVADKFDLRRDIQLETRVEAAEFDERARRWRIRTSDGQPVSSRYLICAVGTLSAAYKPAIPGLHDFAGETFHTGHWPQDKHVDFTGKRVGVIGTGSSGIQAIPRIAETAGHLTVFQRTPQYTIPARNKPLAPEVMRKVQDNWPETRREMIQSPAGFPLASLPTRAALDDTPEERTKVYEALWAQGGPAILFSYTDLLTNPEANRTLADFVRSKIRETVTDAETAEKLLPDYFIGAKRPPLDSDYYETYNRENVTLVDLREDPIAAITTSGVRTRSGEHHPLDMLVLATGYDAMTGALRRLNPTGRGGTKLDQKWADGAHTYLGMATANFPNLFMIHGPESPSVLYNMPMGAERQVDWVANCITYMQEHGLDVIEPAPAAELEWGAQVAELANQTLYPLTDSWYTGANIPGKPRQFAIHLNGILFYQTLDDVAANNYEGFVLEAALSSASPEDANRSCGPGCHPPP